MLNHKSCAAICRARPITDNCRPAFAVGRHSSAAHLSVLRTSRARSTTLSATNTHSASNQSSTVVFTTPVCPYCKRAKALLRSQAIPFTELDVSSNAVLRQAVAEATGRKTVPQVYINGLYLGGADDLDSASQSGQLDQLLAATTEQPLPPALAEAVAQAQQEASSSVAAGPTTSYLSSLAEGLPTLEDFTPSTSSISISSKAASAAPSFTGAALVEYLLRTPSAAPGAGTAAAADRAAAVAMAQQLLEACVVMPVAAPGSEAAAAAFQDSTGTAYHLRRDAPRRLPYGQALNTHYSWGPRPGRLATVVAEDLRGQILAIYGKHLAADGRAVNYKTLASDPLFWQYVDATAELQKVDLSQLSREELMCFGINIYNALIIHGLVVHGTSQMDSLLGRACFFSQGARYNIGGLDYTADDLENGVLRGNRPGAATPGMLLGFPSISTGPFGHHDPRRNMVVQPLDPRIHFALVCGAKSCPPIQLYAVATLEEGLTAAAEGFCASGVVLKADKKMVVLSKIFQWYFIDFGANKEERLRFLLPYLEHDKKLQLEKWLEQGAAGIRLAYADYDWGVNAAV